MFVPKSCLIIDDSESVRNLVAKILTEEQVFDSCLLASDGIEGFKLLLKHRPDIILCDVVMPGLDGFKFLELKDSKPDLSKTPVIMLTSQEHVGVKVKALEAGASDYLTKPFEAKELIARVRVHLKIKSLQDELEKKNAELEKLSHTDGLTKINNRRHFVELLELEFARAERYKASLSYLMIDIDHFKSINDTYGHHVGDAVLVEVSKALSSNLRAIDIIGRYGGEEFGLILPGTEVEGAEIVAERNRIRVERLRVPCTDVGKDLQVTVSIGGATYPRQDIKTYEDLVKFADQALYESKGTGRNCVTWSRYRGLGLVRKLPEE